VDYFTTARWKDSRGHPVRNWKLKATTWMHEDEKRAKTNDQPPAEKHLDPTEDELEAILAKMGVSQ
jgi:hypothetical protein